jgi:hypothetical protein
LIFLFFARSSLLIFSKTGSNRGGGRGGGRSSQPKAAPKVARAREFLKYVVTLPLAPVFAQFLILIVLSEGFSYASVSYTLDLSRVFLPFALPPCFAALVGVFFLKVRV